MSVLCTIPRGGGGGAIAGEREPLVIGPTWKKVCNFSGLWEWAWVSMGQMGSAAAWVYLVPGWMRGSSRRQEKPWCALGAGCGPLGSGQLPG